MNIAWKRQVSTFNHFSVTTKKQNQYCRKLVFGYFEKYWDFVIFESTFKSGNQSIFTVSKGDDRE